MLCPILVGRDDELRALDEVLAGVQAGRGGCAVMTGEAGIGKSRLVRELTDHAAARGLMTIGGRAVPTSVNSPYRPVTEALLQLLRGRELPHEGEMSRWLPALAPVLPGVVAAAEQLAPVAVRGEAVIQLVRAMAAPGLVVVLEDLHWADPDTVELVEYLADNVQGQPVLLALTLRPDPPSVALDMVRRQRGRSGVVQFSLGRLDDAATDAMLAACGAAGSVEHLAWVRQTAEGIPLLIEDLLASPGLPDSIAGSVRARLGELSSEHRLVIETAAVMGRHFDWELLAAGSGQAEPVVVEALALAAARLLLVGDGGTFRFRHALTREAMLAAMLPPHHRAVAARALAAVDTAHPDLDGTWRDVAADLAARAGDRHRAGMLLVESGSASLGMGAVSTAIETLRRAVEVLERNDRRLDAELLLIEALSAAGRVDEAAAVGDAIVSRVRDDPVRVEVHLRLAEGGVAATRWPMVRHQLELAQRFADRLDSASTARLAVVSAEVALADDDPARARRVAEEILALDGVPAAVRCHAFEIVGRAQRLRDLAGARIAFQAALTAAEEAGLPMWRLRALHELGTIDMFDHVGVERLTEARRRAEEVGAISIAATLDLQLSACYTARWQLDRCDAHARSALEVAERLGLHQVRAKALAMLAGSASMRADVEATDNFADLTAAVAPGDQGLAGFTLACRGMAAFMDGDTAGGVDVWSQGMAVLAHLPNAEPASVRALWPLVLASLGDRRARPAIEEARRLGVGGFILNRGLIGYAEAVLAGRAGDPRRAEELASATTAGFVNCEPWAALARFLAAPGARADRWGRPQHWLADAVEAFTALGLQTLAGRAERLCQEAEPNPWAVDGITDREAHVLRLVGQGLANKEIAAVLGVSPRTVEKHVENLLRKTGDRTRVELAVRARTSTT